MPPGQTGLFLADGIPDVVSSGGIDFSIPSTAFVHTDGNAIVQLLAQQADGQALPTWLKFDATTGKFSGEPPPGTNADVAIKVVARDSSGKEAVAVFRVKVGNPAPNTPTGPGAELLERHAPWLRPVRLASIWDRDDGGTEQTNLRHGKQAFSRQLATQGRDGLFARATRLQHAAEKLASRGILS